jgi:hypothetical protein
VGSWSSCLDGVEDIVEFAQIFLPQASRFAVDAAPFGVVVIGVAFDAFFSKRSIRRCPAGLRWRFAD